MSNTLWTMKVDQILLFRVENKNNPQLLAPGQPGPHLLPMLETTSQAYTLSHKRQPGAWACDPLGHHLSMSSRDYRSICPIFLIHPPASGANE